MSGSPQFSFWIYIAFAKICFPRIVINRAKILMFLVGTVLNHGHPTVHFVECLFRRPKSRQKFGLNYEEKPVLLGVLSPKTLVQSNLYVTALY